MKKILWLIPLLALLLMGADDPVDPIRFTVINKSEMDIAIQLRSVPQVCINECGEDDVEFYYLPVLEGSREAPTTKTFIIEKDLYQMQMFYIETWDPVYGFECAGAAPNQLNAGRNIRLVVLPCNELPKPKVTFNPRTGRPEIHNPVGEPSMWKYLPFPVPEFAFFSRYWVTRFIY